MNADIQKAVFDLFCLCVDITQAGRFEVHMDYAAETLARAALQGEQP